jgi:hypothetical protein
LAIPANAVTTTGNIAVRATIGAGTPDFSFEIHRTTQDAWTGHTVVSTMNFDQWDVVSRGGTSQMISPLKFYVLLYCVGNLSRYEVKSTGSGTFTSGGNTLPVGAFSCTPVYAATDKWVYTGSDGNPVEIAQGARPAGSVLGTNGKAIAANKVIYQSETAPGSARILQALYMFPAKNADGSDPYTGYQAIPTTQAAGTYTGVNVVITIAAI